MIDERVALSLDSMKRAAADAISFVAGMSEAEFLASTTILIGASASRVESRAPDFVATHPDWPWSKIRGLRNLIVHDYDRLDMPTIWVVIHESLPDLLSKIESIGELDPRLWPKG